ncbi:DUF2227 family putative metal-binding protein [Chamaesiphon sp.]|uniref:DUF2227 family putative metal-binding protein n=1 Tax=Chamaesiphon sp. TaxID=2814140 RepID=UPI0035933BA9
MSSGKAHDLAILVILPPAVIVTVIYLPTIIHAPLAPIIAIGSYLAGGIWLSPDIDLKQSRPSQRLSILSPLWKPYRKASGHRGFSHLPIVGTLSRMIYIAIPALFWMLITSYNPTNLLWHNRETLGAVFLGLEASCFVHLIMDYTPGLNRN